ncbi:hypothetical protein VCCP1050_3266, partial [Vibrio cholerae CP1050(23)]
MINTASAPSKHL